MRAPRLFASARYFLAHATSVESPAIPSAKTCARCWAIASAPRPGSKRSSVRYRTDSAFASVQPERVEVALLLLLNRHVIRGPVINPAIRTALVFVFAVTAFLVFLFGDGTPSWTAKSTAMGDDAGAYGIHWMWLSGLLVVVPIFVLFRAIFRSRLGRRARSPTRDIST